MSEHEDQHRHPWSTIEWERRISDGHFAESELGHFYISRTAKHGGGRNYRVCQDLNGYQSSTLGMSLDEVEELHEMLGRFIEQETPHA